MYKIYKKDSKNKIRYLEINVEDDNLLQISGILNTENPIVHSKKCTPKNVGKSNETTGQQQAILEATSIYKDKLTQGYSETIDDVDTNEVILPMLAKSFKDEKHKIDWSKDVVFVQPKFDGMRCLKDKTILKSRKGKIISNMMHIQNELNYLDEILDGELYVHGEDFQTNMEYIKKYRPGNSETIKYHVYDIISDECFEVRHIILKAIVKDCKHIIFVDTYKINSEKELIQYHEKFLNEGYEGTMVRISKNGYKANGRSSELLKYKDFKDIDLPILDVLPCKVETEWGEPIYEWIGAKGHRSGDNRLGSGTKMSHEARKDLLLNKHLYIGKIATVRYFELSNTGVPRFPVTVGIRLD